MEALQTQTIHVMEEIRRFLGALEQLPEAQWTPEKLREQIIELEHWVEQLRQGVHEHLDGTATDLGQSLENLAACLKALRPQDWHRRGASKPAYTAIGQAYEAVLFAVKRQSTLSRCAQHIRTLRPTNYHRNLFHVSMSVLGVSLYQWVFNGREETLWALAVIIAGYLVFEVPRRFSKKLNSWYVNSLFKHIARPRETYQVSAATWYAIGLFLAVAIAEQPLAQSAVLALGFGDPAATLVGKRWGRQILWRDRTWAGTTAFVGFAAVACIVFLWGIAGFALGAACAIGIVAGVTGALTELLCTDRVDDNVAIPAITALVLMFCFGSGT